MPKAHTFVPPLLVLFLGCTAISSTAQAGWLDFGDKPKPAAAAAKPDAKEKAAPGPSVNLDESIRQAQLLRLAGSYPEAIKHLSQLMMVAADDPRVVAEYGKTLAAMGRASDAVNFLTRAEQLEPTDWTIYSALGVAYDQVGNQKLAQAVYERALALKPGEPSVLNNYALSRLMAKDTAMAQTLAGRAEIANAATQDEKIARNIAMIRSMAPPAPILAAAKPAPGAAAPSLAAAKPAPVKAETSVALNKPTPYLSLAPASAPVPQSFTPVAQQAMPHALQPPAAKVTQAPLPAPVADNRVVMQRVPVDPLAGPVASHAPRSLQPAAKAEVASAAKPEIKAEAPKPAAKPDGVAAAKVEAAKPEAVVAKTEIAKPAPKPETKTAEVKPITKPETKTAEAKPTAPEPKVLPPVPVKAAEIKPAAKPEIKTADAKPTAPEPKVLPPAPVKAAELKPAAKPEIKTAEAKPAAPQPKVLPPAPVKAAEVKPAAKPEIKTADAKPTAPEPKVLPPAPVKAASAKPAPAKTDAKADSKDSIPGLRLSANAF